MSDRITRRQARRIILLAYELGWSNACNDHQLQGRKPDHPIGAGRRQNVSQIVVDLDPYNVLNLDGEARE